MAARQIDDVIKGGDKWFIRDMEDEEEEYVFELTKRGRSVSKTEEEIDLIKLTYLN